MPRSPLINYFDSRILGTSTFILVVELHSSVLKILRNSHNFIANIHSTRFEGFHKDCTRIHLSRVMWSTDSHGSLIYRSFPMKIRQDKNALPLATRDRGHWPPLVFSIVADIVNISAATCLFPVSSTCSPRCTIMPRSSYVGWNEERERDNEAMERGEGGRRRRKDSKAWDEWTTSGLRE